MLSNLQAEMARHRICAAAIAATIHRSTRTVSDKINGKVQFTVDEAFTVRTAFSPACPSNTSSPPTVMTTPTERRLPHGTQCSKARRGASADAKPQSRRR